MYDHGLVTIGVNPQRPPRKLEAMGPNLDRDIHETLKVDIRLPASRLVLRGQYRLALPVPDYCDQTSGMYVCGILNP